jgi:hypothetical protein
LLDGLNMCIGRRAFVVALASCMIASANMAEAKRVAPKEVPSVVAGGIRFKVPHFGALHNRPQNGGYVEAWDVKTGKLLWDRMVYRVHCVANLEKDVQDDFISEITVKGGHLFVKTERSETFDMDLETGKVRALTPLSEHIEVTDATETRGAVQHRVAGDRAPPGR